MSKNKLQQMNVKESNFSALEHLDLSGGFSCDLETGICGPTEEVQKKKESIKGEKEWK